jgi:hypothetical protein
VFVGGYLTKGLGTVGSPLKELILYHDLKTDAVNTGNVYSHGWGCPHCGGS